jgi:ribosomal protein S18 acetylase RimI-like enzyme
MFRMAELNRIQQGFPHIDKELHRHIVAVAEIDGTEEIIGFCDLDGRIPNRNTGYSYNPRPYLSDLCISPDWRRKGIAKAMIEESERYSIQVLGKDEIFIRVESTNEVALALYESLEYVQIPNPDCPKKHILLLKKRLESGVPVPVVIER